MCLVNLCGVQNYVESEDDDEQENQKSKRAAEDEAEYLPSSIRPKSRQSRAVPSKTKAMIAEEELNDAMKTLGIRNEDMETFCRHFKIPHAFDRKKRGEGGEFYTAS
jgi:hypothetical protein